MAYERHPSGIFFVNHLPEASPGQVVKRDFGTASELPEADQHYRYLPLLEVSSNVKVTATTSQTLLSQTFVNDFTVPNREARYCFPLYDGSVIISFRCWVGGKKMLEGTVKPRAAAKAEYQEAFARQRVAALLEEHTPEIFETTVGNIPPQTIVRVEIVYVNELKVEKGGDGILVTIPTSIAPRYGTPPTGYPAASAPNTTHNGLKIEIDVFASSSIKKLESRTHPISVELGSEGHPTPTGTFGDLSSGSETRGFDPKKARASLADRNAVLGKDFVLVILLVDSRLSSPRALIQPHPSLPDHSVLMATIIPQEMFTSHLSPKALKAEIIFVADRSGSMLDKMEALIHALRVFLKSIPEECYFNICSFGSTNALMWPISRLYTQTNLDYANEYLSTVFRADMGGTELLPALENVVQHRNTQDDLRTEVVVLTDGQVWNAEPTCDFIRVSRKKSDAKIRFFALGIGNAVSHRLVEGIGREGGGYAEIVAVDAHGQWQSRVIRMLQGALTPSAWQCEISFGNGIEAFSPEVIEDIRRNSDELQAAEFQRPSCIQAPFRIPTLHTFSRFSVFFILNRKLPIEGEIKIQAVETTGETVKIVLPLELVEKKTPTFHSLAAKAVMNDLETEQSWLHSNKYEQFRKLNPASFEKIVRREAESLGQQWSIAGKWTSFVAVDKENQQENMISLYRAERNEFSEMIQPLNSNVGHRLTTYRLRDLWRASTRASLTRPKHVSIPGFLRDTACIERENPKSPKAPQALCRRFFGCRSSYEGCENLDLSGYQFLYDLVNLQTSSGYFPLSNDGLRQTLLKSFFPNILDKLEKHISGSDWIPSAPKSDLCETVIVIAYIEKKHANSLQLWDLVIKKALDGLRKWQLDDSACEKLCNLARENFRESSRLASQHTNPPTNAEVPPVKTIEIAGNTST